MTADDYTQLVKRVREEVISGLHMNAGKPSKISNTALGLQPTNVSPPAHALHEAGKDVLNMRFVLGCDTTSYLNNGVAVLASKNDPPISTITSARVDDGVRAAIEKKIKFEAQREYDEAPHDLAKLRQIVIWLFTVPEIAAGVNHMLQLGYRGSEVLNGTVFFQKLTPYFDQCEGIILMRDNTLGPYVEPGADSDMRSAIENASKREFGCVLRVLERMLDTGMCGPAFNVNSILDAVKTAAEQAVTITPPDDEHRMPSRLYKHEGDPVATWSVMAGYVSRRGPCEVLQDPGSEKLMYRFPDHRAPVHVKDARGSIDKVFMVSDERPSRYNAFYHNGDLGDAFDFDGTGTYESQPVRWIHPDTGVPANRITNFQTLAVLLEHIISTAVSRAIQLYREIQDELGLPSGSNQTTLEALQHAKAINFGKIGSAKLQQLQSLQIIRHKIKQGTAGSYASSNLDNELQYYTTPVVIQEEGIVVAIDGPYIVLTELTPNQIRVVAPGLTVADVAALNATQIAQVQAAPPNHNVIPMDTMNIEPVRVISHTGPNLWQVLPHECLSPEKLLGSVRFGVRLCHLRNPSDPDPDRYDPPPSSPATKQDARTRVERDRSFLWDEVLREVNIGTDRLWMFVKILSGSMGEPADSLLTLADENAQRAQRAFEAHKKEISTRVGDFHAKLIESVVGGILRSSKLEAIPDQDKNDASDALFVADAEMAKEIRALAAGESGRPFFEANVAVQEILRSKNGKTVSMASLIASLTPVVTLLNEQMQAELEDSYSGGIGLSGLSNPRNSFLVNLRNDVIACLRISLDRLHREMGTDRVSLWELVEGASSTLSLRFAELVAHVLQTTRASSGTSALYVSAHMKANNVLQTRLALSRLVNECRLYITKSQPPKFGEVGGRDAYFAAYRG